jgi:Fe2+ or Zn2+ uptake regulation protein
MRRLSCSGHSSLSRLALRYCALQGSRAYCPISEYQLKIPPEVLSTEGGTDNWGRDGADTSGQWNKMAGAGGRAPDASACHTCASAGGGRQAPPCHRRSLFEAAKGQGDAVSLATVYNTLRAFCEAGLLQEVTVDGSKSYFDTNTHDHPHFYWEDDGKLTDAPSDQLIISNLPDAPEGAEIASVDVVIRLRRKA